MLDNIIVRAPQYHVIPLIYGYEECLGRDEVPPASRDFYLLHYVHSGQGVFNCPRGSFVLSEGQMFIIHPNEITSYMSDPNNPWSYTWIGFKFEENFDTQYPVSLKFLCEDFISSTVVEPIFNKVREISAPSYTDTILLTSLIHELIYSYVVTKNIEEKFELKDYIEIAIKYIEANYSKKLSVNEIAEFLGIDRRYFCNIFHKKIGMPPQDYIINFRLSKAAELLRKGISVTAVASACGYPDIYSFSKMFKRRYEISPSKYGKTNGLIY